MKVEVHFHSPEGEQTVVVPNVHNAYFDTDTKILCLEDSNGDGMGDFKEWTYWQKVQE